MAWDFDLDPSEAADMFIEEATPKKVDISNFNLDWNLGYDLYDDQKIVVQALRDTRKRVRFVEMPTGMGKTLTSVAGVIIKAFEEGRHVEYYFNTHDQAEIVLDTIDKVNRLNPERRIRAVHIGGRSRLCNFAEVKEASSEQARINMCRKNTSDGICKFKKGDIEDFIAETPLMSMSDMLEFSSGTNICPRKVMSMAMEEADVIALPTIYLFIPAFNGLHENSPSIIIDESHAFDSHAVEMMSNTLSENQLENMSREISDDKIISDDEDNIVTLSFPEVIKNHFNTISGLLQMLPEGINNFDQIVVDISDISLLSLTLDVQAKRRYVDQRTQIDETPTYYDKFMKFINKLLEADANKDKFVFIKKKTEKKDQHSYQIRCLDPSYAFGDKTAFAHDITLMSGTLNPPYMRQMLGVPSAELITITKGHDNIRGYYIGYYGDNKLSTAYKERSKDMMLNYANTLFNIVKQTPSGGILVFSPLYKMSKTLYESFNFGVPKFFGGKKGDLYKFKRMTEDGTKAIFISAMRGSGSEGINFPDNEARAICILGVPFLNKYDDIIAAQEKFYANSYGSQFAKNWLLREAAIAVSQAAGRGNRHKDDYSVVFFLDVRSPSIIPMMPQWLANQVDWSTDDFSVKLSKAHDFLTEMDKQRALGETNGRK